ncbi:MAG: iron-sulfur cluster assembly accessory protein [Alphaproteobacteria bacterium]|nr:iron-sulfur cluster assembly accessory protein [Rickettsiales bacterium]
MSNNNKKEANSAMFAKSLYNHVTVNYISITENAQQQLLNSLTEQLEENKQNKEKENNLVGIKISLTTGSCGAFSYNIEYAYNNVNISPKDDLVQLSNNVNILIDPNGSFVLFGLQINYEDDGIEYGFKFSNPNETSKCKCGTSFYAKEETD